MAIDKNEMKLEENNLLETEKWIDCEINSIQENNSKLEEKLAFLRKQSKGKYSEELETTEKLYKIAHKNFTNYLESKSQPYFARIDFREYKRRDEESYYLGKLGLGDFTSGEEKVIDWRSPIADLYYSGTLGEAYYEAPIGIINGDLTLKRKFIIKEGKLLDAFDEGINQIILKSDSETGEALVDEFLKINLEESTSSKLKDVVATIQKEQNSIIRSPKNSPLIVQGSAGSGKTTVALHRLAYLLYKYKKNLTGKDILVVAPNKLFLNYISDVLPNLGVDSVRQKTFEEVACEILNLKGKVYTKDKKLMDILEKKEQDNVEYMVKSSSLKGSIKFKKIMDKYLKHLENQDSNNIEDIKFDNYIIFNKEEIERLFTKDLIKLSLNERKEEIKRYLSLKIDDKIASILEKINFYYEYKVARLKNQMDDSVERRKKLIETYDERDNKKKKAIENSKFYFNKYFEDWKNIDTKKLYMELFNDDDIANDLLNSIDDKGLFNYMKDKVNENYQNKIIDSDDIAPMLYIKFKIEGVPLKYKFKHIVVDEVQDYSAFEIIAMKHMAVNNSFTLVGDIGQGIYYYKGISNWERLNKEVFEKSINYVRLSQSYRSTVEIINFANLVLSKQENNLQPAMPVLRHGENPKVIEFKNNKDFCSELDEIVKNMKKLGKNNIAIIGKTQKECKKIKAGLNKYSLHDWKIVKDTDKSIGCENIVIPSYMTKGLEFDCSIVYNCNSDNYSDSELDKKLLYVVLTRALHFEYIFYSGSKSILIEN